MVAKDATERVTNAIRASMATTGKMMAHALTVALMTANAIAVMKQIAMTALQGTPNSSEVISAWTNSSSEGQAGA